MTVSANYAPNVSTGNGVTTVFPYNFRILAAADLEVTVDGVVKTQGVDYTLTGVGSGSGGNVTFTVAPANGTAVIRRRDMALTRAIDYQDNGDLLADVMNPDQDAPVMMLQQQQDQIDRSIKAPLGDATDMTLPSVADRATKALVFGADGSVTVDENNFGALAAAAAASAGAAAGSAGAAAAAAAASAAFEAQAAAASLGNFLQSGSGAVARTYSSKVRETVSVRDFGAVGDGVTDDSDAIRNAIASFPTNLDSATQSYAGTVFFPPGTYYCASTIQINRQVVLRGVGSPAGNNIGLSQIWFADNITGFVVNTNGHPSAGSLDASGTMFDGLYIKCVRTTGTLGNGILMSARAEIRNCVIESFRENGVFIKANAGSDGTNANNWHIEFCRFKVNGGNGLFVQGADTNAGTCIGLDCSANSGVGIYDSSFLGNTYIGCHTASNVVNGYKSDNINARNLFVGCYSEGGETSSIAAPSMVIGGPLGAPTISVGALGTAHVIGEGVSTPLKFRGNDNTGIFCAGPGDSTTGLIFSLQDTSENSGAWPFRMIRKVGGWIMNWSNSGRAVLRLVNSQATVANGYTRETQTIPNVASFGGISFDNGFFFGSLMKFWQSQTAAPATGTYVVGDIVWNTAPAAGGFLGWVCTAAGTPGTWQTFGRVAGNGGQFTQTISKSQAFTLNKTRGEITMNAASLAAGARVQFTLNNSVIGADDTVHVHRKSGGTAGSYIVGVDSVAAGSCVIYLKNDTAGALAEAVLLQFEVFPGAIS